MYDSLLYVGVTCGVDSYVGAHARVCAIRVRGAAHPPPYRHDATARGMLCEYMEHLEHLECSH